jgi:hypothetical protein
MKYLCLVYLDERKLARITEDERGALQREALAFDEELRANGRFIAADMLDSIESAAIVRIEHGAAVVSDGPFAETTEHLGGFLVIDARDLNDAIRIAAKVPPARLGCIEVRPIKDGDDGCGARFARITNGAER